MDHQLIERLKVESLVQNFWRKFVEQKSTVWYLGCEETLAVGSRGSLFALSRFVGLSQDRYEAN